MQNPLENLILPPAAFRDLKVRLLLLCVFAASVALAFPAEAGARAAVNVATRAASLRLESATLSPVGVESASPLAVKPDRLAERIEEALTEPDPRRALLVMTELQLETVLLAPSGPNVDRARTWLAEAAELLR